MTAKDYLKEVRYLKYQIRGQEEVINAVEDRLYSITGIDPSREKVCCHTQSDISDRIIKAKEQRDRLEEQLGKMNDALDGAKARIEAMESPITRALLQDMFINNRRREKIMKDLGGISTATYARWKRRAIAEFGAKHQDFLASITHVI